MEALVEVRDQTLSLDEVEADHKYVNCYFETSPQLINLMDVTFDHCEFDQTDFDRSEFVRVTWIHSQLAGASFQQCNWYDCQLKNIQLSGVDFSLGYFRNTDFRGCKLSYANFTEASFENIQFIDCDLLESFFQAVKLKKQIVFPGSRLTGANLGETKLKGFDLHEAEFESLIISPELARGLVVSQYQAAILITLFGIKIE